MKVLFVGDSPSKTNTDPNIAFLGAKCEPTLREWVTRLCLYWHECDFVNQSDPDLMSQKIIELHMQDRPGKIVALGEKASHAVRRHKHFKLPHPSGRNRQLNDPGFITKQLEACKQWLDKCPL